MLNIVKRVNNIPSRTLYCNVRSRKYREKERELREREEEGFSLGFDRKRRRTRRVKFGPPSRKVLLFYYI